MPPLAPACLARGARTRAGGCGNGGDARIRAEFEVTRLEIIERALILEKNDLAECFAAGLESDAHLREGGLAHLMSVDEHATLAAGAADDERAFAHRGKYRVGVAVVEEVRALARVLEKLDRFLVVLGSRRMSRLPRRW